MKKNAILALAVSMAAFALEGGELSYWSVRKDADRSEELLPTKAEPRTNAHWRTSVLWPMMQGPPI